MPPKGRGRKRPISASSVVDEVRAEVEQSISAETVALDAFRVFCSTSMSLDAITSLPNRVVDTYLSAKFDKDILAFVTSSLSELRALPESVRTETLAKLSGLAIDEVSNLIQ